MDNPRHKIQYLLNRFKKDEWSGPAWYKVTKSEKNGFPVEVSLVYFKAIHLGHGTETELDGDKMGKLLPKVYKKFPELIGDDTYLGLIHSHHTMGAFLSETDKNTAREQPSGDGMFFSTVVASEKKPYDCCMTYTDRFGYTNLIEGEVSVNVPKVKVLKEWTNEANAIVKAKKAENKVGFVRGNQISMYNGYNSGYGNYNWYGKNYNKVIDAEEEEKKTTRQYSWDRETIVEKTESNKMMEILEKMESNEITYDKAMELAAKHCPNLDPHLFIEELATGGFPI